MSVSFEASRNCSCPTNNTNHSVPFSLSLNGRMRGLAFLADRFMRSTSAPESVMPVVMLVIDEAKLPATRLAFDEPISTRSALSVSHVLRWVAVAASNRMPLTRWPADEPRPAGADSEGSA